MSDLSGKAHHLLRVHQYVPSFEHKWREAGDDVDGAGVRLEAKPQSISLPDRLLLAWVFG